MTSLSTTFKQNLDMEASNTTPNQLSMAFSDNGHSVWYSKQSLKVSIEKVRNIFQELWPFN